MKCDISLLVGSAMLLTAMSAQADEQSVRLSFAGTLVAPACSIAVQDGGKVDFGDIQRSALNAAGMTPLRSKPSKIFVSCNAKSQVAVSAVDNRTAKLAGAVPFQFNHLAPGAATYTDAQYFSLGASAASQPIGAVAIRVRDIEVDSVPHAWVASGGKDDAAEQYVTAAQQLLTAGNAVAPASGPAAGQIATGEQFVFPLDVAVTLDKQGNLPAAADTRLDGSITLDVRYL